MANYNLTNQTISSSFEQLVQHDNNTNILYDGTGSVINNLEVTSSLAISSSHAENSDNSISSSYAISSSQAENSNTAISASHAILADNAIEIFVSAKNTSGFDIPRGTAVHSSGVTGDKININTASYEDPNLMPAIGITQTAIANNQVGEVILTGRIQGLNTSNLTPGATVYVNGDGSLTSTRPTGSALIQNIGTCVKSNASEGEILVLGSGRSNDLPNITEGYAWVGNGDHVPTAVSTASFATTGSNDFVGDQTITSPSSTALTITSGVGDTSPVIIEGGFNGIDKFTDSSIRGINIYGGNKISGSWGQVGSGVSGVGSSRTGIYNHATSSTSPIALRHSTLGTNAPDGEREGPYDSFTSKPSQANSESLILLKGTEITLQASTGSKQTSVTVDGDVTGSTFTGSFVGDGTGLTLDLPSGLLSSSVTDFNTYSASVDTRLQTAEGEIDSLQAVTGSYATTGSNTFIGNQTTTGSLFVSGNLEIANTEDIGADPIVLGPEISIIPEQLNIERRLHVTQSSAADIGAIVLQYPFTGSGGSEGNLRQRFYQTGSQTRYEQRLSGVDAGEFVAVNTDLQFKTEGGGGVQFIVPNGGVNFNSAGTITSNQMIQKTTSAVSGNGQKDSIQIGSYTGANGVVYNTNVWGIQNYPGSGYNNAFTIGKYNSAFTYVSEFFVGEGAVKATIAKGNYDYDFILLQDNQNGTTSAVIKADQIQLGGSPNNQIIAPAPVTLQQALTLGQQDPLPSGGVGQLAVSSSADLYYHNGTAWAKIN